eukprot:scaffold24186_cov80-Skeletonema_menzelii.AAC.1
MLIANGAIEVVANANAVAAATGDDENENAVASGAGHVNTQAPQPQPQQRSWKIIVPAVCVASAIIAAFATAFSPRSSSVVSSNAAAAVPKEALSRYVNVGNGGCRNATNADDPYQYVWYLFEDVEITAEECAGTCECIRKSKKITELLYWRNCKTNVRPSAFPNFLYLPLVQSLAQMVATQALDATA